MRLTLSKQERLTHERQIKRLWEKDGNRIFKYPLLLFWVKSDISDSPRFKVLFSVSKKRFKRSHDRNRIKRLMRESFRLQKSLLYEIMGHDGEQIHLGLQFIGNELPDYHQLNETLIALLQRFTSESLENS